MRSSYLFFMSLVLLFGGCVSSSDSDLIENAFEIETQSSVIPLPTPPEGCSVTRYQQVAYTVDRSLDLLFVIDTSSSLYDELDRVADGIDAFIDALPSDIDLRVAVLMGHGPNSSWSGRLYQVNSEPAVLSSADLSRTDLRESLRAKLTQTISEGDTDGGEVGLLAYLNATEGLHLLDNQTAGFFRETAAQAVVFVSDENDICATYPEGVSPVVDPQGSENRSFQNYCSGVTPSAVVDRVRTLAGDAPSILGAVVYNNLSTVPPVNENEYGYGYVDTVSLAGGITVDLANGSYDEGLARIASLVQVRFDVQTSFPISSEEPIDPGSIQVAVDGLAVPFRYENEQSEVLLLAEMAGIPDSVVDVTFCPQAAEIGVAPVCTAGSFSPKASLKAALVMDPNQGALVTQFKDQLSTLGVSTTVYDLDTVETGVLVNEAYNLVILTRVVALEPASEAFLEAIRDYLASGGSLIAEEDGAALFFSEFSGGLPVIANFSPPLSLFEGFVSGGGALLPISSSRAYVTDPEHPIMQGMPTSFLNGLRRAFAVSNFEGSWISTHGNFISTGYQDLVPEGTYPAVMSARCGEGRIVLFPMNFFNVMNQSPINLMVSNSVHWVMGF